MFYLLVCAIYREETAFAQWVDIMDFLKTYDITFSTGFQFRSTHILERINLDVELRDKARRLFRKQNTNQEIVEKLISELTTMGFAELINEEDGTYKVTAAFRYAEDMVNLITIYNEEEAHSKTDLHYRAKRAGFHTLKRIGKGEYEKMY